MDFVIMDRFKVFLFGMLPTIIFGLIAMVSVQFDIQWLNVTLVVLMVLPLVCIKLIMNRFSLDLRFEIDEVDHQLTVINYSTGLSETLPFRDFSFYSVEEPNNRFRIFKLYRADKSTTGYALFLKKEAAAEFDQFINEFVTAVRSFNKTSTGKMQVKRPFWASQKAVYTLGVMLITLLAISVMAAMISDKGFPMGLGCSALMMGQLSVRRFSETSRFRSLKKLEDADPI